MEKNSFTTAILRIFATNPFGSFNHKQVASRMDAHDKGTRKMILDAVSSLAEEGILVEEKRGRYRLNPKYISDDILPDNYMVGKIDTKTQGNFLCVPQDETAEPVEINPRHIGHALHGDMVKIILLPRRSRMKSAEGQVVEVLQRDKTQFVGKIKQTGHNAFLIPDLRTMQVEIEIAHGDMNGAADGEKVLVEMTSWPDDSKWPFGKVLQILGKPGENEAEMLSILAEFDFPLSFPKDVEKAAEKIPVKIPDGEISRRRDFRNVTTFTIDPADAKDFDDALSFRTLPDGNFEIGVHIADVSHYVTPGSPVDQEAYSRGTSVYLVDRTIPMLPEVLCNNLCSLRPNEDKLCFSAVFEMNSEAEVLKSWFGKTVINSNRRFSYEEAQMVIDTGEGDLKEEILKLNDLAQILKRKRFEKGAISFESTEVKFKLDENAKPIGVYVKEQKEANFLIEEFMLLANRSVAEFVGKTRNKAKGKTFVYRVHDEPNAEKFDTFANFVKKLGYSMKGGSGTAMAKSINKLLADVEGKGEQSMIDSIAIRTMAKASYSTDNIGHYGLAFKYYTHFTSPIRRYPDLMVHRLLDRYLAGGESVDSETYEEYCKHSSQMERKAADAERTSVKYKQAEFLADKTGQVFDATISGITKWGIYAEINDNKCEGMISLGSLHDDYYYLDEDNYQVIGRRYGNTYRMGSPVKIKVLKVDMYRKQIDFELVSDEPEKPRFVQPKKGKNTRKPAKSNKKSSRRKRF